MFQIFQCSTQLKKVNKMLRERTLLYMKIEVIMGHFNKYHELCQVMTVVEEFIGLF